eukprot:CAMPEP_0175138916 /NCGR_PEP_ID=MMETSP0087-20121206/10610_1 /TAXON_ID=136419 /ORGANISM="Unknown Unknown, Strain D1" /LENGTH=508 /DNA_ID=CAMNT_0016421863 /DNA_START=63 /DNA_END=1585 /DNA_ORIENTATION=-
MTDESSVAAPVVDQAEVVGGISAAPATATPAGETETSTVATTEGTIAPPLPAPAEGTETARPRKRKSRWGNAADTTTTSTDTAAADGADQPRPRKSRWGGATESTAPTSAAGAGTNTADAAVGSTALSLDVLAKTMTPEQLEVMQIRYRIAEITQKMMAPEPEGAELSPSPEPIYNSEGKRINTRTQRRQSSLAKERTALLERAMALSPEFQALKKQGRQSKKIFIPQAEHPDYNFIGLIIGPRGNTHRRMEKESNTKISIRGKGAHKSGRGVKPGNVESDNEPLHVWIQGENQESVDMAAEMIEKLLKPMDEDNNAHKAKQLRELAQINGTQVAEQICRVCGEKGHIMMNCPNKSQGSWQAADVTCSYCGSNTHPERDCPKKAAAMANGTFLGGAGVGAGAGAAGGAGGIDSEYASFMAEVMGEGGGAAGSGAAVAASSAATPANPSPPAAAAAPASGGGYNPYAQPPATGSSAQAGPPSLLGAAPSPHPPPTPPPGPPPPSANPTP